MCDILNIKFVLLLKLKLFIKFDNRYIFIIIYVIYFKSTTKLYFKFIIFLLIIDLNNYSII